MKLIEIRQLSRLSEDLQFRDSESIAHYCSKPPLNLQTMAQEVCYCICLDSSNRALSIELISKGSLTNAIVHPREVLKAAILSNSASIILVHNHPSGETSPSQDDIAITNRLKKACELMGINLIDHIIIGKCSNQDNNGYFSFNKQQML